MNPSQSKRNIRGLINTPSTPLHDAIHLWFFDTENQKHVLRSGVDGPDRSTIDVYIDGWERSDDVGGHVRISRHMVISDDILDVKIVDKSIEVPLTNSYRKYLLGIVDCLITYSLVFSCKITDTQMVIDSDIFSRLFCGHDKYARPHSIIRENVDETYTMTRRSIIEIKPKLDSISSTIGQIAVYRRYLPNVDSAFVLTTDDETDKYDALLKREGITVFRIPKSALDL